MNDPNLYMESNYVTNQFANIFIDEYEDEIGEMSGQCIDIGAGPGNVTVDFLLPKMNAKANILCSDISDTMVEFGKEKYKNNRRLSFTQLDIESPDLPDCFIEKFDHATSFYCLHWCRDMRQVFTNILNLLRPGGTSLVTFIANFPGMDAYKELATMPLYQPYMKDVDRFIPVFQDSLNPQRILKALVKDVGFHIEHCSIREQSYTYKNPNIFNKFMQAVNPFISRIPTHLKTKYENDLMEKITNRSIVFNKHEINKQEYSVLSEYHTCVAYLRKPQPEKLLN